MSFNLTKVGTPAEVATEVAALWSASSGQQANVLAGIIPTINYQLLSGQTPALPVDGLRWVNFLTGPIKVSMFGNVTSTSITLKVVLQVVRRDQFGNIVGVGQLPLNESQSM